MAMDLDAASMLVFRNANASFHLFRRALQELSVLKHLQLWG